MNWPYMLWCDDEGTLFVVESGNNRITVFKNARLKENGADADIVLGQPDFVSNAAGLSASTMNTPRGICVDKCGTLYVTDNANHRVLIYKKGSISTGHDADYVLGQPDFITDASGTSAKNMKYGRALYFDNDNYYLWVLESGNSRAMRFSPVQ